MNETTISQITARLSADMRSAMKAGNKVEVSALRSLLSRITNAEAVAPGQSSSRNTGVIAGAVVGVGATEVPRRALSQTDVVTLVEDEIKELREALATVDSQSSYGQELQQKITAISKYVIP